MKHPLYFGALLTQKIIDNFLFIKKNSEENCLNLLLILHI